MKKENGFTLIELMVVMMIIGILAAITVPNLTTSRNKSWLCEGLGLANPARQDIVEYYNHTGVFPKNNAEAGLPEPETIKGHSVQSITVTNGTIEIKFNSRNSTFKAIILTPVIHENNPTGPFIWKRENIKCSN